jgi:replicative DNA helicase
MATATEVTMPAERTPPHSIEAEQAVLGGLLLKPECWPRITNLIGQDFYRPDHRLIFSAIADLASNGKGFDTVIIEDVLKRRRQLQDVGGLAYLATLQRDTPGAANLEIYADTVRGYSLQRRLIELAEQLIREAASPGENGAEILARTQEKLIAMQAATRTGTGLVDSTTLAHEFIDDLDNRRDRQHGLQIGLVDFDELTHGLEPGDLVVIAGRPGMGKSALLVTVAAHVAQSCSVGVFSAEMPSRQLMRRSVALAAGVSQTKLRTAKELTDVEWETIAAGATQIAQLKLWIDDSSSPTMAHVRSECTALKARAGLGLVVIDYLQLLRGAGVNRYEQLRDIAYSLKALAKDLAVPVIALAQLNRGVESREEKRPHASDLRDSGAIEEAADIIGLLFSEGFYDRDFSMRDVLECAIVKHRNGERGLCLWSLNGAHSRVTALDAGDAAQYRRMIAQQKSSNRRAANDL